MQKIKSGKLFGYVQCDLKVPEHLKSNFANFPPIFKNTVVSRNDIGDLIEYAEEEGIMSQPRRMLISSFHLKRGKERKRDIILKKKRNEWEAICSRDCTDSFTATAIGNFFPRICCTAHKKHDKREPSCSFIHSIYLYLVVL